MRAHVVVDGRKRSGQRRVEKAHHAAGVVGVGARKSRVGGVGLLDDVKLAGRAVERLQTLEPIRSLAEHDVVHKHVGVVEPHTRPFRNDFGP